MTKTAGASDWNYRGAIRNKPMKPESKKKLYYDMLRIRRIEEAIAERYHEQEMRCPVHLCIGQEAIKTFQNAGCADSKNWQ